VAAEVVVVRIITAAAAEAPVAVGQNAASSEATDLCSTAERAAIATAARRAATVATAVAVAAAITVAVAAAVAAQVTATLAASGRLAGVEAAVDRRTSSRAPPTSKCGKAGKTQREMASCSSVGNEKVAMKKLRKAYSA
jgi:hypothetical protein